jgi:hypothetical protein
LSAPFRFAALLAALLLPALGAAQPAAFDQNSTFYLRLMANPLPAQVDEMLFVHDMLRLAGEEHRAARVKVIAERAIVHGILGQAVDPLPARISEIPTIPPYSDSEFDKQRTLAMARMIELAADVKGATPQHITFRNISQIGITGFHAIVSAPSQVSDLQCRYEGLLGPRETTLRVCPGYNGPRLASGYKVTWLRVEPGGYEMREGKGAFADRMAKTRERIAALPPAELKPPAGTTKPLLDEKKILRGFAQIALMLGGPGLLLGLLVGALVAQPRKAMAAIVTVSGILAAVAGVAGFFGVGMEGGGMGGLLLIFGAIQALAMAILAGIVWMIFNLGVWIGCVIGALLRRLVVAPA